MVTNSERREVAERLRKATGLTEFAEALGFNWTDDSDWGWKDVSNLVADLIEPSEPKVKCVAEVKVDGERLEELVHDAAVELTGVDRDALLAMADEMDHPIRQAVWNQTACMRREHVMAEYARRIREACGVSE